MPPATVNATLINALKPVLQLRELQGIARVSRILLSSVIPMFDIALQVNADGFNDKVQFVVIMDDGK